MTELESTIPKSLRSLLTTLAETAVIIILTVPASATSCEDVSKIKISGVSITSASDVAAGHFSPPLDKALDTPAFCRVVAMAKPTSDSVINFEVWIPTGERWNQDFLGVGNGGYNGAIQYAELADGLNRGFAAASTDTGHTGADLEFAAGHPEKIVDWGYRAVHVMTESAKLIIREYSGRRPEHSFFMGCSTGGHQTLSEVQRFPADYDGVVAGDPGNNRVHLNVGFLWDFAATHDANGKAILPSSKLALLNKAALVACAMQPTGSKTASFPSRKRAILIQVFFSAKTKKMINALPRRR